MKFFAFKIRLPLLAALFFLGAACGLEEKATIKVYLIIEMFGVFEAPVGAEGTYEPKWQNYLFKGVYVTPEGSAEQSIMTDPEVIIRIVGRSQIVFKKEFTEWEGTNFTSLRVNFDPTVLAAGRHDDNYPVLLDTGDVNLVKNFTAEKNKDVKATLKVKWKNTIKLNDDDTETVFAPGFDLTIE